MKDSVYAVLLTCIKVELVREERFLWLNNTG